MNNNEEKKETHENGCVKSFGYIYLYTIYLYKAEKRVKWEKKKKSNLSQYEHYVKQYYVTMETFIVLGFCFILYEALDFFQSCYSNNNRHQHQHPQFNKTKTNIGDKNDIRHTLDTIEENEKIKSTTTLTTATNAIDIDTNVISMNIESSHVQFDGGEFNSIITNSNYNLVRCNDSSSESIDLNKDDDYLVHAYDDDDYDYDSDNDNNNPSFSKHVYSICDRLTTANHQQQLQQQQLIDYNPNEMKGSHFDEHDRLIVS